MGNKGGKAKEECEARVISDDEWGKWKPAEGFPEAKETTDHKIVIKKLTTVPFEIMKERVGLLQNMEPHPGLATVVGILKATENVYVVTEYVQGTSLEKVLEAKTPITWGSALQYALDICDLGAHFHKDRAFHRNLKPSNIIVLPPGERTSLKLTDFNAARGAKEDKVQAMMTKAKVKNDYMAPEQFNPKIEYGPPVDVYAFGMILWNILTGSLTAYPGTTAVTLVLKVMKGERPKIPDYIPDSLKDLLKRIWEANPEKRITFAAAREVLLGPVRGELVGKLGEPIPRIPEPEEPKKK